MWQINDNDMMKQVDYLEIPSKEEMSDHEDIASIHMVFSLSYSFEATHVPLSYLDNDCEYSTNKKVKNYSNRPVIKCDWLGTRCTPIKLTIAMRRYIKPFLYNKLFK